MRSPLRLNRSGWPKRLTSFLPSSEDPRSLQGGGQDPEAFTRAVSVLRFGATFKTTREGRFPITCRMLASLRMEAPPVILDVGASAGVASLDVMRALPFRRYFVADLHPAVWVRTSGGSTFFYDAADRCILAVTDRWVAYPKAPGAVFPLDVLAGRFFRGAPESGKDPERIALIHPALREGNGGANVECVTYDVLTPWTGERVDLVIAANLLNRSYFPEDRIRLALGNLAAATGNAGRIALVDSRESEKASLIRLRNGAGEVEWRTGGGTEIEGLALEAFSRRRGSPSG